MTKRLAEGLGLRSALLPATDDPLRTFVETPAGTFPFQEWFVARGHRDEVDALHFTGAAEARPAPGVLEAIEAADLIVIAPSNPYVSIWPILAVSEIRAALERRTVPCVAVSPLIGGRAVKGPADRMLARLAGGTGPAAVAGCYPGLIDALVIDEADAAAELPARGSPCRRENLDGRRRRSPPARTGRAGRRRCGRMSVRAESQRRLVASVRVAILGGTGSFGRALAARLVAAGADEIVIGSRDEARAKEAAAELGPSVEGATNETPCETSTSPCSR